MFLGKLLKFFQPWFSYLPGGDNNLKHYLQYILHTNGGSSHRNLNPSFKNPDETNYQPRTLSTENTFLNKHKLERDLQGSRGLEARMANASTQKVNTNVFFKNKELGRWLSV